jgi:urease alpha subunit
MKRLPILISMLSLILGSLACTIFIGGPDIPNEPIPISTEAVTSLKDQVKVAVDAGTQSGQLSLTITESQLTSLLASRLQSESDPFITDPQVYLREGQIRIFGKAHQGYFEANVGIVVAASVDDQGQPKIEVISADFGPMPAPQGINEAISALIQEAFGGALGPVFTGFRVEAITVSDGVMLVTGRIK